MNERNISITTSYIKLESLLKLAHAVSSGGEAKIVILDGKVQVNGSPCVMRGKKLQDGDTVCYAGMTYTVVYAPE